MWIGPPDPWSLTRDIEMGQWPYLLRLPGFAHQPPLEPKDRFLLASRFAAAVAAQGAALVASGRVRVVDAMLTAVVPGDGVYRLEAGGKFLADRVDICTGGGPSRMFDRATIEDPELVQEYAGRLTGGLAYRRILTGEQYLERQSVHCTNDIVCVAGDGPTSAWCVESALTEGNAVRWLSRTKLGIQAFPGSGRNQRLREEAERPGGRLSILEGYEVRSIAPDSPGRVRVGVAPTMGGPPLEPISCAQMVGAIGQTNEFDDPRAMAAILSRIIPPGSPDGAAIRSRTADRRFLGLQSSGFDGNERGALRVLGAAAMKHPERWQFTGPFVAPRDGPFYDYFAHLCHQAKGLPSIPMAAHNIAEANGWFSWRRSVNLNTAPHARLAAAASGSTANRMCEARSVCLAPYLDLPSQWSEENLELFYSGDA
ncbi:MAG: hypothetical protein R2762_08400 [Bryobacteraceae bacterium]